MPKINVSNDLSLYIQLFLVLVLVDLQQETTILLNTCRILFKIVYKSMECCQDINAIS